MLQLDLVHDVFIGRDLTERRQAQRLDQGAAKAGRFGAAVTIVLVFVREQGRVVPHRLAVDAPENIQGPARQGLAGIPFALAVMQHGARGKMVFQALHELPRQFTLLVPVRQGIPFGPVHVVDGDKGGLPALGQAHILPLQVGVHLLPETVNFLPVRFTVRLGDARVFMNARDRHLVRKANFGLIGKARHRRRR